MRIEYAKRKDQHSWDEHRREGDDDLERGGHAARAVQAPRVRPGHPAHDGGEAVPRLPAAHLSGGAGHL